MPSKYDLTRATFDRAHSDLFGDGRYSAEFFNYSGGSWSPQDDEYTGETKSSDGTISVELVPPAMDTTVDTDGTSFSWDTSIRFPEDESVVSSLKPLGEDNDRPTEIEITDQVSGNSETFELHGYTTEVGSGMVMCRLVEQ